MADAAHSPREAQLPARAQPAYHSYTLATFIFDLALCFWRVVLRIFFRSIRPRGAFHIPKARDGTAVIFAAAPHHNQFLDALILGNEAFRASGRRVSFLTAEKSLRRGFIGPAARALGSIGVVRAADRAKPGVGRISYWPADETDKAGEDLRICGYGTQFTKQLEVRGQLVLPKSFGSSSAEVEEIISDTECRVKRKFKDVPNKLAASQALTATPVSAEKGNVGVEFTVFPYIDQSLMYGQVFKKLTEGGSLGIFPEGGSHDRTDLLPLKRGVVIMALGAMEADPQLKVNIVPVGMSYFHPHKFRSRAVVEFGSPIEVPSGLVTLFAQGGEKKREAVEQLMELVFDGLKSVTVQAPDYETLQLIQAGRRLYVPPGADSGHDGIEKDPRAVIRASSAPQSHVHLTLGQVVDLNRRFILGYLRFQDLPQVQQFKAAVLAYNRQLKDAGLRDHQVEVARQANWQVAGLLGYRIFLLLLWGSLALPGFILNLPIFVVAKVISRQKAKEALAASQVKLQGRDVLATWKVLVSLALAPILYSFYAIILAYFLYTRNVLPQAHAWWLAPLLALALLPLLAYSVIKFGEAGVDIYKSLPPLILSLIPGRGTQIEQLQQTRRQLSKNLQDLIDELAPQIWPDYEQYKQMMIARARKERMSAAVDTLVIPKVNKYAPPGAWVSDEDLFGWTPSGLRRSASAQGVRSPAAVSKSPSAASMKMGSDILIAPGEAVPDLSLPQASSEVLSDDVPDDVEYEDAMDDATRQVEGYATTFTAQAKAEAAARSRPAAHKASSLSESLSKFFPPKDDKKRSSLETAQTDAIASVGTSTSAAPAMSETNRRMLA